MAVGPVAKLQLGTPYKTPARRDLVEGKLALHLRGALLVPSDADAAAASGGKLFGTVNVLWHVSWMCLYPYLLHVLLGADFELDADKGCQPRASPDFLVIRCAVSLLDPALNSTCVA